MFSELLARIGRTLDEAGVTYMVIGGQAVLVHGEPRLTADVDVTLGAGLDRLEEVVALTRVMGLEALVDPESFTRETMVLPCQDPATEIRVDLILSTSPYEQEALGRVRTVSLEGHPVRFASAEDLLIHKLIAGRPRDLEDARGVLLKNCDVDLELVRRWLREYGTALDLPLVERLEELRDPE